MQIVLNSESSIEVDGTLAQSVGTAVRAALDRFGDRITGAEAHLSDEDGDNNHDPHGTRCRLEVRLAGLDPVVVTGSADTAERACHDAAQKMQSLLDSTFARIDSRQPDATIRHSQH